MNIKAMHQSTEISRCKYLVSKVQLYSGVGILPLPSAPPKQAGFKATI